MTTQRKIVILQKAKTKFDIACALNNFESLRRFDLYHDIYTKLELLRLKEEFLKKYVTSNAHNIEKSLKNENPHSRNSALSLM